MLVVDQQVRGAAYAEQAADDGADKSACDECPYATVTTI
jgi:hypothetical protein